MTYGSRQHAPKPSWDQSKFEPKPKEKKADVHELVRTLRVKRNNLVQTLKGSVKPDKTREKIRQIEIILEEFGFPVRGYKTRKIKDL